MEHHLAQVNVGRFIKPVGDPANADFMAALDQVNALAEASPGFIWRLIGEGNNATDIRPYQDLHMAINMSLWESIDQLAAFAYRNIEHRAVMRRRREWFAEMKVYMALWWAPVGHIPTVEEAKEKLALLEQLGPTPGAFTFKQPFAPPSPSQTGAAGISPTLDECA